MKEIDDVQGLADYIGVTAGGVYNMRHKGQGPKFFRIGGRIRYRRSDVDEWLETQVERSTDVPA